MDPTTPDKRITLDSQLVDFWLRESRRLDTLAAQARFGWQRRRYARKADQARGQAERNRLREAARGRTEASAPEISQS